MIKLSRRYTARAVERMYELGLNEKDILKIFALYDDEALIDTLKYYKYVSRPIPPDYFYYKLNFYQGWGPCKDRAQIFKRLLGGPNVLSDTIRSRNSRYD